jgi:hypothetical protein
MHVGDELFDFAPAWCLRSCGNNLYAKTDIARLYWCREFSEQQVVWFDSDALVFDPRALAAELEAKPNSFGREVIIYPPDLSRSKVGLHNAIMSFQGKEVLDEYVRRSEDILRTSGPKGPRRTEIGPKLLANWSKHASLPVLESAIVLTAPVLRELLKGRFRLVPVLMAGCAAPPAAANLCNFFRANLQDTRQMRRYDELRDRAVSLLLATRGTCFRRNT